MFSTFFKFEIRYWLTRLMVYIFLVVVTLLFLGAVSSDNVRIGSAIENTYRNAPYVIQTYYMFVSLLACLMTTAFVNDSASRDFAHRTSQLIFTKPVGKFSFLAGRFTGATVIALLPILGVSLAALLAPAMPWNDDPSRFGDVSWGAHFWGIVCFALPNTFFVAAIVFAIAVWLRSTFASFIGIILLLAFYGISQSLVGGLDSELISQLADPFGGAAFSVQTKYWTVDERNTQVITLFNPMILLNRAIWISVGGLVLGYACLRFSFAERTQKVKKQKLAVDAASADNVGAIPNATFEHGWRIRFSQLMSQFKVDLSGTLRSPVFLVIVFAGMLDTFASLQMLASQGFGLSTLPVTYSVIEVIRASLFIYLIAVITFYSGALVWKEREAKFDEVMDAMPHPTWISYAAKIGAMLTVILIVLFAETLMGVINQAMVGFTDFQFGVYAVELFLIAFLEMFCFTVLAFFSHIVSPNKYIGYFLFILLVILNVFAWTWFDLQSNLFQFAGFADHIYSDMFGFAPFAANMSWFGIYWLLFCLLLSSVGILFWQRGKDRGAIKRTGIAASRFVNGGAIPCLAFGAAFLVVGGWLYYNTAVVNEIRTTEQTKLLQASYEKEFKSIEDDDQPSVTKIKYDIDIYPKRRGLELRAKATIQNKSDGPISKLYLNLAEGYETQIQIPNATLSDQREDLNLQIYNVDPPLEAGQTSEMEFQVSYFPQGIENSVSRMDIVQNGTFFNNSICPQFGYNKGFELTGKNDRKEQGLGEDVELMPELDPDNLPARSKTYLNNIDDWIDVETVISTSAEQMAIAPGSLIRKWTQDGRNYFHYKVDHPSLNFYSFISADYEVKAGKWKGVDVEVYYHRDHFWNVDKMARSITKSLEYYSEAFGPYRHKQARIIEFPRVASFAQAFPGTMPYSEGIGFIADIKDEENDIDMVYYVVAHEMAHQWWAHQVAGANMLGATLLSETLAQYSALMVMEKEYGRDMMRKFLRYEMDSYLKSRSGELLKERPLQEVAASQGYVHYRKGSVVMYQLKEMIGEDKVNAALRTLVDKFAYNNEIFPTSLDLVNALRDQTPPELHYLIDDLFAKITLFENRTTETKYKKLDDGKFEVTVNLECRKFQADDQGKQSEIEVNDWIEIGAFAKPEGDSEFGATLYRERVKIDQSTSEFTFVVDRVPDLAGVDPFSLLIDRFPEDNMKEPFLVE
ncbi:MAG: M1 family aminopeptidase [Planctomycetota bacterium]